MRGSGYLLDRLRDCCTNLTVTAGFDFLGWTGRGKGLCGGEGVSLYNRMAREVFLLKKGG